MNTTLTTLSEQSGIPLHRLASGTLRGRPKPYPDRRQAADTDDAGVWRS